MDYAAFGVEQGPFGLNGIARVTTPAAPAACTDCPHVKAAA